MQHAGELTRDCFRQVYWEFMFADYLILLVESVHNYKMILPYLRGELTFENPVMKVVVGLCLLSCALQYIQQPIEALADPCVAYLVATCSVFRLCWFQADAGGV